MIVDNLTMILANLTMIIANLALARSVNYDRKLRSKLKRAFMIVNYDPKPLIVQATGLLSSRNITVIKPMVKQVQCFKQKQPIL
jgi:uncharacterized membrane protein YesL